MVRVSIGVKGRFGVWVRFRVRFRVRFMVRVSFRPLVWVTVRV